MRDGATACFTLPVSKMLNETFKRSPGRLDELRSMLAYLGHDRVL